MTAAAPSVCEACGVTFGCGAGTGSCWCREETVAADVLAELRERFSACLCPSCLAAAARRELATQAWIRRLA